MKRAYQPLLFAFAIAVGLYIWKMQSQTEPFYYGSLTNPSNLSSTGPSLSKTAPKLPTEIIIGSAVVLGVLFIGIGGYGYYKSR